MAMGPLMVAGGLMVVGFMLFSGPDIDDQTGPRLSDLKKATSTYGAPIIKVFGTSRVPANYIWSTPIIETKHVEEVEVGKGGAEYDVITYTYSASFACGICEGPVSGIRKVWCDSILVYDVTLGGALETLAASGTIGVAMQVFDGTSIQKPSWVIQAVEGDDISAFRNLCYVVFNDLQLEKYGNRIPNITVEVVAQGEKIPIEAIASAEVSQTVCVPQIYDTSLCDNDTVKNWSSIFWYKDGKDLYGKVGEAQSGPAGLADNRRVWNMVKWSPNPSVYYEEYSIYSTVWGNLGGSYVITNIRIYSKTTPDGMVYMIYNSSASGWPLNRYAVHMNYLGIEYNPDTIEDHYIYDLRDRNKLVMANDTFICRLAVYETGGILPALGTFTAYEEWSTLPEAYGIWKYVDIAYAYCYIPNSSSIVYVSSSTTTEFTIVKNGTTFITDNPFGIVASVTNLLMDYDWQSNLFYIYMVNYGFAEYSPTFSLTNYWPYNATSMGAFNSSKAPLIVRGRVLNFVSEGVSNSKSIYLEGLDNTGITLTSFLDKVYLESGLATTDFDNSAGSDILIQGYAVQNNTSARNMIATIKEAFQFDAIEKDFKLQVVKRSQPIVSKVLEENIIIQDDGTIIEETKKLETELPNKVTIQYLSSEIDYQTATQHAKRIYGNSDHNIVIDLPLSYDDASAKQTSEILLRSAWLAAKTHKYTIPLENNNNIAVGDVLKIYNKEFVTYLIDELGVSMIWLLNEDIEAITAKDKVTGLTLEKDASSIVKFGEPSIIDASAETCAEFSGYIFHNGLMYRGDPARTELYYPYSFNFFIQGVNTTDAAKTYGIIATAGMYVSAPGGVQQIQGIGWLLVKQAMSTTTYRFLFYRRSEGGYWSNTTEGSLVYTGNYSIDNAYNIAITVNGLGSTDVIIYVDGEALIVGDGLINGRDNLLAEAYAYNTTSVFVLGSSEHGTSAWEYNCWAKIQEFSIYQDKLLTETNINTIINREGSLVAASRITKISYNTNNTIDIEGINYSPESYISTAEAQDSSLGFLDNKPTLDIPTRGILIDTVLLDNSYINTPSVLATSSKRYSGWKGCTIYTSADKNNYVQKDGLLYDTLYGTVYDALEDAQTSIWDDVNSIEVVIDNLDQVQLESVTELQVYNGANYAILGSEVIQFKNATFDQQTRTWILTNLLRGRRGTERETENHVDNEKFILLRFDATISNSQDIGTELYYKFVTFNTYLDDAEEESIINTGISSRPLPPSYLATTRTGELTTVNWIRKDRYIRGLLRQLPMSEDIEQYKIEVKDLIGNLFDTYYSESEEFIYDRTILGNLGTSLVFDISQYSNVYGYGLSSLITDTVSTEIFDNMDNIGGPPDPLLWDVTLVDETSQIFNIQNEYMIDPDGNNAMYVQFNHPSNTLENEYGYIFDSTYLLNVNNNFSIYAEIYIQTRLPQIYLWDYISRDTGMRVGNYTLKFYNYSGESYRVSVWFGTTKLWDGDSVPLGSDDQLKFKTERILDTIYFYTNLTTLGNTKELVLDYSTNYTLHTEDQIQLFCIDDGTYAAQVEIYFKNFKGTI